MYKILILISVRSLLVKKNYDSAVITHPRDILCTRKNILNMKFVLATQFRVCVGLIK